MSQSILMQAVRDLLRLPVGAGGTGDGLDLADTECEVMFDGQPPPACGERFVAIHAGSWTNRGGYSLGREDVVGVEVTVTRRVAFTPRDRPFVALRTASNALDRLVDQIIAKLHMNYAVTNATNLSLGGAVNGYIVPLVFLGCGRPEPKGPDWFSSDAESTTAVGVTRTISFGEAQRDQTIESQG